MDRCDLGSRNAVGVVPALAGNMPIAAITSTAVLGFSIRVSLPIQIDEITLVYVGGSNSSGHFLLKVVCRNINCI